VLAIFCGTYLEMLSELLRDSV